jgi:hypothetical protein
MEFEVFSEIQIGFVFQIKKLKLQTATDSGVEFCVLDLFLNYYLLYLPIVLLLRPGIT